MKHYLLGIVTGLLFVTLGYGVLFAWSGLTASDGDTLDYTKWNELVDKVGNVYSSGSNVGIGTTSPQTKLHVDGMIRSTNLTWPATGKSVEVGYHTTWDNGQILAYDRDAGTYKDLQLNGNLLIDGDGNVGIGTSSPNARLHVDYSLQLGTSGTTNGIINIPHSLSINIDSEDGGIGEVFQISHNKTNLNNTDVLFHVGENGNVGIGTTSPAAKLDINGSIKISDGTQGVKKVLTSDANGLASWGEGITTGTLCGGSMYQEGVGWIEKASCNGMAVHVTCPSGYTFSNLLDFNLGTHIIFSSCVRN